jgi:hypothetical protein
MSGLPGLRVPIVTTIARIRDICRQSANAASAVAGSVQDQRRADLAFLVDVFLADVFLPVVLLADVFLAGAFLAGTA